jgi:hypothetical protein
MAPDVKRAYVSLPATGQIGVLDVAGKALALAIAVPPAPNVQAQPDALAVVDRGAAGLTLAAADSGLPSPLLHLLDAGPTGFGLTQRASLALGGVATELAAGTVTVGGNPAQRLFAVLPDGDRMAVVDPAAASLLYIWGLGTGLGESLSWAVQPSGAAYLSSTTAPQIVLTGRAPVPTPALIQAAYTLPPGPGRGVAPYTFEVRVKDTLQNLPVVIRKEQYDVIMNILNAFHPIGVEVLTADIRRRVLELSADQRDVLPEYTYPNFRLRARAPRRPTHE